MARAAGWTVLSQALCVLCAWVVCMGSPGCDRDTGAAHDQAAAEQAPFDIELTIAESSLTPTGASGESVATLTIEGRTATLGWTHSGALAAAGAAPPSGSVELTDAQLERLHKILDKTGLGQSDIDQVESADGPRVRVSGHFGGDAGRAVEIQLATSTPLTERPPSDDTAVFAVEAARALVGEVARMLATDP